MTTAQMLRRHAWSDYWKTGNLHSLPTSFHRNYEGEILACWHALFRTTSKEDRILDIGTGNGALPEIALRLLGVETPRIDAIDAAEVTPTQSGAIGEHDAAGRIRFHSNTDAESTPFPAGTFDAAISQYGFEYSHFSRSVPELARVLRPGGRVRFIMHHANSKLADVAAGECVNLKQLLRPQGLLDAASEVYPFAARIGSGEISAVSANPHADSARRRYNEALKEIEGFAQSSTNTHALLETCDFLTEQINALLRAQRTLAQAMSAHHHRRSELSLAFVRSEELISHSLDEASILSLCEMFEKHGLSIDEPTCIWHGNLLLGWRLDASRI